MIERALQFAEHAHRGVGQKRKYTGDPYIVHPVEVMGLLVAYANFAYQRETILTAALLHDVVEDTFVTLKQVEEVFGHEVAGYVDGLTDKFNSGYEENGKVLNRRQRKDREAARLANETAAVQTIKCADLISNTRTIVAYDRDFAKTYIPEKRLILGGLQKADTKLFNLAMESLLSAETSLAAAASQTVQA
jgi:(p)ppGpp synthase/HD superfamily hydrolase